MRRFTFLSKAIEMNGISLREEIVETIYEFCVLYHNFVEECRAKFLSENPHIDPNDNYSYSIPHHKIEQQFPEGKLWHSGSDYDEQEQRLSHYLFLDSDSHVEDYFIEVEETDYQEYIIYNVEIDNSRHE